jgi:hypothetical protein
LGERRDVGEGRRAGAAHVFIVADRQILLAVESDENGSAARPRVSASASSTATLAPLSSAPGVLMRVSKCAIKAMRFEP